MRITALESQIEFKKATDVIDNVIAEKGFCPRRFYEELMRYRMKHMADFNESDREVYWHREIGCQDPRDVHQDYFQDDKGNSIHISFEIAENLDERNKVHFGANNEKTRKLFKPEIDKLRRLAKKANDELDVVQAEYDNTPEGICNKLDSLCFDLRDEIEHLVTGRRGFNYREIQKSSSSDRSQILYEHFQTGHIGRVTFTRGSPGWQNKAPYAPTVSAFFEDPELHEAAQEIIAKADALTARFNTEVLEEWEAKEIIKRLEGKEEAPF